MFAWASICCVWLLKRFLSCVWSRNTAVRLASWHGTEPADHTKTTIKYNDEIRNMKQRGRWKKGDNDSTNAPNCYSSVTTTTPTEKRLSTNAHSKCEHIFSPPLRTD